MKTNEAQFTVRMSAAQKAWLSERATANRRSASNEILTLIDAAMDAERREKAFGMANETSQPSNGGC